MIDRNDFARGREAIGVLQGHRAALGERPRRLPRATGAAAIAAGMAASALVVAAVVLVNNNAATGQITEPSPNGPGIVAQAPAAPASMIAAESHRFASWTEAQVAVPWIAPPKWLPASYRLSALQGFSAPFGSGEIDSVIATYTSSQGGMLTVDEFHIARPEAFNIALTLPQRLPPEVRSGEVPIGDLTGYWAAAVALDDPTGESQIDTDATVLTWAAGTTGYRLTGRGLDLESLRMIADSIAQP